ncbi:peptide/nickel transport system permease protein [Streptomyces sp. 2224.1]|uniref:ABC transporter permease n=1 Tax=unclassified Streptomyces TaxID=2593676 RepID=UPI00088CE872|nr:MULTISPECIES: ABC transporter permease [unclassified Streptomyces]PBC84862.1 peptide/nickel transport system permease protein [Streptomyces sp. 2321.6]SDR25502.1 peptide/nickel transport system permease protein [Streptomyces sp. KS_16]SEB60056.1 peptide/nickel transport system permease protein [Streptomyces sp. 2224.1]SED47278.1 peptide/nickel transport system permease protein [Streptomyces sp. 2133.1]SEE38943.1 peptide/nickel transport system permease protein [Streptomyces sp. 2112.3]
MLPFLLRRTLGAVVILLLLSAFTFFVFFSVGDPALMACGKNCTAGNVELIRQNLGLDQPVPVQYWHFLAGIFAGRDFSLGHCSAPCFGYSFATKQDVWSTMMDRLPLTASLALGGAVAFLVIGLGAGLLAAWKRGSLLDKTVTGVSMVLSSVQIYILGPVVLGIFVYSGIMAAPQYVELSSDPAGWFMGLLIPWLVMATIFTAQYTRMARSTMIEQLQEEHVRTAKAKGMPGRYVFLRYAWRGSLIPIVTILGVDLGTLFGGAMITEFTFQLAGLGRLAVDSVTTLDLPMVMGVMLFSAALILICNIIVDATYAFIDPRVRLS